MSGCWSLRGARRTPHASGKRATDPCPSRRGRPSQWASNLLMFERNRRSGARTICLTGAVVHLGIRRRRAGETGAPWASLRECHLRSPSATPLVARSSPACEAPLDVALHFPTRAERPGHLPHTAGLRERAVWPEFLYHDPVLERLF